MHTEILRDGVECSVIVAEVGETMNAEVELFANELIDVGEVPFAILACSRIECNDSYLEVIPVYGSCSLGDRSPEIRSVDVDIVPCPFLSVCGICDSAFVEPAFELVPVASEFSSLSQIESRSGCMTASGHWWYLRHY